jgi:hypothetical protein
LRWGQSHGDSGGSALHSQSTGAGGELQKKTGESEEKTKGEKIKKRGPRQIQQIIAAVLADVAFDIAWRANEERTNEQRRVKNGTNEERGI